MAEDLQFKVKHRLNDEVVAELGGIESGIVAALMNAVRDSASKIKQDTMNEMKLGNKTGRVYIYNGRQYRASAPGEAPAVRSGVLYNSMRIDYLDGGLKASIHSRVSYAKYLKRNRPILAPFLEREAPKFISRVMAIVGGRP